MNSMMYVANRNGDVFENADALRYILVATISISYAISGILFIFSGRVLANYIRQVEGTDDETSGLVSDPSQDTFSNT